MNNVTGRIGNEHKKNCMIRTIQNDWLNIFRIELSGITTVRIVSPFVKENMIDHLIKESRGCKIQFITRYNLNDFRSGASSLKALKKLVDCGAEIRGIKGLHSKLYLFDFKSVIITSANFTSGGFFNNKEFGVVTDDQSVINQAQIYFNDLWKIDTEFLNSNRIDEWSSKIQNSKIKYVNQRNELEDYGASRKEQILQNRRYFIKFFGTANYREDMSAQVENYVRHGVSHYALSFSKPSNDGRPKRYRDGDIVFMARMSNHGENDYSIFARGETVAHDRVRDIAGPDDIAHVGWVAQWPILVRVRNVKLINGTLADCPRMSDLTNNLGYESFDSTIKNYDRGIGNISTKAAVMQKSDVRLSDSGALWMEDKFVSALDKCGAIPRSFIDQFYRGIPV